MHLIFSGTCISSQGTYCKSCKDTVLDIILHSIIGSCAVPINLIKWHYAWTKFCQALDEVETADLVPQWDACKDPLGFGPPANALVKFVVRYTYCTGMVRKFTASRDCTGRQCSWHIACKQIATNSKRQRQLDHPSDWEFAPLQARHL